MDRISNAFEPKPLPASAGFQTVKAEKKLPREILFSIDAFQSRAKKPYYYEIVGDWKSFDVVLYISALSPDGGHLVKFEKHIIPVPDAREQLTKIAESIGATPGRWC
jgi:hypothetical protein